VKRGELLFAFVLHYLISPYRKLKLKTKSVVSKAYVAWTGSKIVDRIYKFTYP